MAIDLVCMIPQYTQPGLCLHPCLQTISCVGGQAGTLGFTGEYEGYGPPSALRFRGDCKGSKGYIYTDPLAPSPSTHGWPSACCMTWISAGSMAQGSLRRALSALDRACAKALPLGLFGDPPVRGPGEGGPHSRPAQSKLRLCACPSDGPLRQKDISQVSQTTQNVQLPVSPVEESLHILMTSMLLLETHKLTLDREEGHLRPVALAWLI